MATGSRGKTGVSVWEIIVEKYHSQPYVVKMDSNLISIWADLNTSMNSQRFQ